MRILLYLATNLAVLVLLGIVMSVLGIDTRQTSGLLFFAALFGMGGSFISLAMSKWLAIRSTGAQVISQPRNEAESWLVATVDRQARQAGIDNITFTRGTLTDFNAENASFDAVLGLNVIHLLPDREAVIAEVARILRPGGIFVSSTACLGRSFLRFIKLVTPLGKILGLMPDVFVITEDELAEEVMRAGFKVERQWSHGKGGIVVFLVARKI